MPPVRHSRRASLPSGRFARASFAALAAMSMAPPNCSCNGRCLEPMVLSGTPPAGPMQKYSIVLGEAEPGTPEVRVGTRVRRRPHPGLHARFRSMPLVGVVAASVAARCTMPPSKAWSAGVEQSRRTALPLSSIHALL